MSLDKQHLAHLRRLVERQEFSKSCKKFSQEYSRFHALYKGLRYDLQEYAHLEENISGYYWKETVELPDLPSFTIYYTLDESTVYLQDIEVTPKE